MVWDLGYGNFWNWALRKLSLKSSREKPL